MKRDLDLLRAILLRIEEAESNIENHKTAKAICVHYVLPVLAGVTVVLLIQSISTR